MRYRGGGVGHLYMREVEQWLQKTGWGCSAPGEKHGQSQYQEEDVPVGNDPESEEGSESDKLGSEPDEEEVEEEEFYSEPDEQSDEAEIVEDEETLEGEFGYSAF